MKPLRYGSIYVRICFNIYSEIFQYKYTTSFPFLSSSRVGHPTLVGPDKLRSTAEPPVIYKNYQSCEQNRYCSQ